MAAEKDSEASCVVCEWSAVHSLRRVAPGLFIPSPSIKRPVCASFYHLALILNAGNAVWEEKWKMTIF